MKLFGLVKTPLNLVIIFLLSLIIRVINPLFGYPILYVIPDEVPNYLSALQMLAEGKLISFSHYPPLGSYIQVPFMVIIYVIMKLSGIAPRLSDFKFFLVTHEGALLFISRITSAVFGAMTVLVVYKIAGLMFSRQKRIGLWASLILCFSTTHIAFSHLGKPWTAALFFNSLVIYFVIKYYYSNIKTGFRYLITAFIFIGIAAGFHFSSLISYPFLVILAGSRILRKNLIRGNLKYVAVILIPLFFLFFYQSVKINPYIPHQQEALFQIKHYLQAGLFSGVLWYLKEFFITEPVLFVFFILGIALIGKWSKILKFLLLYLIIYFVIFAFAYFQSLHYMLHIYVVMAIISAYGLNYLTEYIKNIYIKLIFTTVIVIILVIPSVLWLNRFILSPTFILTRDWVNNNIPKSKTIAYMQVRFGAFSPGLNSIAKMQATNSDNYRSLEDFLNPNIYPDNVREVIYLEQIIDIKNPSAVIHYLNQNNIDYLINYYWDNKDSLMGKPGYENLILVKSFSPLRNQKTGTIANLLHNSTNIIDLYRVANFGPLIEIFKSGKSSDSQ